MPVWSHPAFPRRLAMLLLALALATFAACPATADQSESPGRRVAAASVAAGWNHTCAILETGALRCWGHNGSGQLGLGTTTDLGDDEAVTTAPAVPLDSPATAVTAGAAHTCVLQVAGTIRCWGYNGLGQLGLGTTDDLGNDEAVTSVPPVALGARAMAVSAGAHHSCALLATSVVRCWGMNSEGELGLGTTTNLGDDEPVLSAPPVPLGAPAVAIAAGNFHTCALLAGGGVRCWGENAQGQLGLGNTDNLGDDEAVTSAPVVPLGAPAVAIAAGGLHTCALLVSGDVRCWGLNAVGELGLGDTTSIGDDEPVTSAPVVPLGGRAVAIAAGDAHSCALMETGAVRCWGFGFYGALGLGSTSTLGDDEAVTSVAPVPLGAPAVAVTAGSYHTCAILAGGVMRCWGENATGKLGLGENSNLGDDEAVTSAPPIDLGAPVRVRAVTHQQLEVGRHRDRNRPFRFRLHGIVTGDFASDPATCVGVVRIHLRAPRSPGHARVRLTRHAALRASPVGCRYRAKVRVPRAGRYRVIASLPTTDNLVRSRDRIRVRAG